MEMEIFASISKREIKGFFLYFSRKYEAHKAFFSTKETNLLGRGYRISFQKEIFRHFTKNQDQTKFSIPFMTLQKIGIFGSELKKRIIFTKISETDSKQASIPNAKVLEDRKNFNFLNKNFANRQF